MMHRREVPIGNSGQMVAEHYHSGTECQYGMEPQPLSRYLRLRFQSLQFGRLLYGKSVSREIDFFRATSNRESVERMSAQAERYRLRLN
jgi:hypothetical protein